MFLRNNEKDWCCFVFYQTRKRFLEDERREVLWRGIDESRKSRGSQRKGSCSLLSRLTAGEVPHLREAWGWDGR